MDWTKRNMNGGFLDRAFKEQNKVSHFNGMMTINQQFQ